MKVRAGVLAQHGEYFLADFDGHIGAVQIRRPPIHGQFQRFQKQRSQLGRVKLGCGHRDCASV
jgi:hypothetical protein